MTRGKGREGKEKMTWKGCENKTREGNCMAGEGGKRKGREEMTRVLATVVRDEVMMR